MNTLAEIQSANTNDNQDVILEYRCICCGHGFRFYNRTQASHELICPACDLAVSPERKEKFYRARLTVIEAHPEWYPAGAADRVNKFLAHEIMESEIEP